MSCNGTERTVGNAYAEEVKPMTRGTVDQSYRKRKTSKALHF